jgi:hypothetical protein
MAAANTTVKASDVDNIIHDGVSYTKKYTPKSYAGLKTEVEYKAMWDGLFLEIDELFVAAFAAVQQIYF